MAKRYKAFVPPCPSKGGTKCPSQAPFGENTRGPLVKPGFGRVPRETNSATNRDQPISRELQKRNKPSQAIHMLRNQAPAEQEEGEGMEARSPDPA